MPNPSCVYCAGAIQLDGAKGERYKEQGCDLSKQKSMTPIFTGERVMTHM
ncbi:UNVERIFIED_CONTAM: hypothetical protein FKN15_047977 [Acipenser sinensis]